MKSLDEVPKSIQNIPLLLVTLIKKRLDTFNRSKTFQCNKKRCDIFSFLKTVVVCPECCLDGFFLLIKQGKIKAFKKLDDLPCIAVGKKRTDERYGFILIAGSHQQRIGAVIGEFCIIITFCRFNFKKHLDFRRFHLLYSCNFCHPEVDPGFLILFSPHP